MRRVTDYESLKKLCSAYVFGISITLDSVVTKFNRKEEEK